MKLLALSAILLAASVVPRFHGDFGHYTFALTWQPGICSTAVCTSAQPHAPLIGLHGLWASRPRTLVVRGVPRETWWSRGCDLYRESVAPPPISPALRARLVAVMPHFAHSLLTHEYDKHVQCFGFDPIAFFSRELAMRSAVARGTFGRYLISQQGRTVPHRDVIRHFYAAFATTHTTSLALECERNSRGREVLAQIWVTIDARRLAEFPRGASLADATTNQDTCPASFLVPSWRDR
ncbi:MAG: ribonuclease T2 family protein [Candidatus Tyrphobacter sp.]